MNTIHVITDSHSGITQAEAAQRGITVLPMPFLLDGECCYEDVSLTRAEFYEKLRQGAAVSTSQPSPETVARLWDEKLAEYGQLLYLPISSGLSGSCMAASALAQQPPYKGRVFVVDNGRVSTPQHRAVLDALALVEKGYSAFQIKRILEAARAEMTIYVAVNNLERLRRGGRISAATSVAGTLLGIKPVLQFDVSTLNSYKKCRGFRAAREAMIEAMRHDLQTRFKPAYDRGEVHLLAASSSAPEVTKDWVRQIEAAFPGMPVLCDDLSLGVSCHIGEDGLGIGCSCKPREFSV